MGQDRDHTAAVTAVGQDETTHGHTEHRRDVSRPPNTTSPSPGPQGVCSLRQGPPVHPRCSRWSLAGGPGSSDRSEGSHFANVEL